jgi:hypothetical protein
MTTVIPRCSEDIEKRLCGLGNGFEFNQPSWCSGVLITLHPSQLFPHMELIPLFRPTRDLAVIHLENRRRMPRSLLACRFDTVVRLAAMTARGGVPQTDMSAICKYDIVRVDFQVRHGCHDFGVGFGVVLGRFAAWEGRGGDEVCIVLTEMLNGNPAFILFWRVC